MIETRRSIPGMVLALAILLFVVINGLPHATPTRTAEPASTDGTLALQAPGFVQVAGAAPLQQTEPPFNQEAGIAAYFQKTDGITINDTVRGLYRTIETEPGLDYIIGQVQISSDYDDEQDAHVYISSSGWVVAYYQRGVPTSKIIDWRAWTTANLTGTLPTKLETVLTTVGTTVGASSPTLSYYHFGYPNANRLTLAAEYQPGGPINPTTDSFTINLPDGLNYALGERSWAVAHETTSTAGGPPTTELQLTNTQVTSATLGTVTANAIGWAYKEGTFVAGTNDLQTDGTDQMITISSASGQTANGYGGVAVVYRDNS